MLEQYFVEDDLTPVITVEKPNLFYSLIKGDCIQNLAKLDDESINLCIVDLPYSSGTRQTANRVASQIPKRGEKWSKAGIVWDSSFSSFGLSTFANILFRLINRKLTAHSHVYSFIDWRHYPLLSVSMEGAGLFINNLLVWDKGMYTLGGNYRSQYELIVFASKDSPRRLNTTTTGNVLKYKRVANGVHPTQKPVSLIRKLVSSASDVGDVILDPMAGSGSTMKACQQLSRSCICMEINETYCSNIQKIKGVIVSPKVAQKEKTK